MQSGSMCIEGGVVRIVMDMSGLIVMERSGDNSAREEKMRTGMEI